MKRLLVALVLVLMTSGTVLAHGGFGLRINLGFPLFYPYYSYPVYRYPVYGYPVTHDNYNETPRAYQGQQPRKVIENYYVNGQLVERRIKIYDDRYGNDSDRHDER
jgi:hypothetical protein